MVDTDKPALSNSQLGELLGVGASHASYLRTGARLPSAAVQRRIVEEFEVSYDELNAAIIKARVGDLRPWQTLMVELAGEPAQKPSTRDWGNQRVMCRECNARPKQPCRTRGGVVLPFGEEHKVRREAAQAYLTGSQRPG